MVRWLKFEFWPPTPQRLIALALGAIAFGSLLVGSILTYQEVTATSRTNNFEVCLAGAEAQALLDVGREALPEDRLPASFEALDAIASELDWRQACDRLEVEGIELEDVAAPVVLAELVPD